MHREHHPRAKHRLQPLSYPRVLDHRHPDRVAGDVAKVVAALGEALRDGAMDIVGGRAVPHRRARRGVVLLVSEAIERLRDAGYEMELTLRLEIGLRPHASEGEGNGETNLELTDEDVQVLQRMKIRIDPEEKL